MSLTRALSAGMAIALTLSCGSNASSPPASPNAANNPSAAHKHAPCGDDGLYALPPYPEEELAKHPAAPNAVAAFEAAHTAYAGGDAALASKKFLEAARGLAKVPSSDALADWARIVREVSYHNALWSASVAGSLSETQSELKKTAGEDAVLADEINSMLADAPAECEK